MAIEKWVIQPDQTKVIDLEVVRRLKVSLIGGRVNIIGHDEPNARVEVSLVSGKELTVEIDGDRLLIDHPMVRWDNFIETFKGFRGRAKAEVSILVPRDVEVKLGVVTADALVAGLTADARLSTVSGEIVTDSIVGDLDLNSVSGELSIGRHTGGIRANTVSGDITASGDITRFSADGVSGNMIVDATETPRDVNTNTVSGNLTLRLTRGTGARYRVNTVGGKVQLDDTTVKGTLGKGFERVIGSLDGGDWLDLQANSVSGDIAVVAREAAASSSQESTATNGQAAE
ncbi:DUF4097 family beta strand repeat-containing protein [Leifsonia sp. Leaf264]|uniref:DUF4097 family beta strand repeat-containing protein n=1 Tax=Leifsonia sp. Leaf264 TaxID=1736314 RepID=UPI0006FC7DF4|nr:DUF4097 family beta strand repeat-containing protein [Leifsonia sp. Leaf264]KQO97758.1 hypothetical protein ASF30_15350 [Leifsonia sp. Leaf264]